MWTEDKQREAVKWFIERFIRDEHARTYALTKHGFVERETKMHPKLHKRHADVNFVVQQSQDYDHQLILIPVSPEAAWLSGIIFWDNEHQFQYRSHTPKMLI